PGRSSRKSAPLSPPLRNKTPCAPAPKPSGAIWFWPATGPRRDCRRPSKARSAPAFPRRDCAPNDPTGAIHAFHSTEPALSSDCLDSMRPGAMRIRLGRCRRADFLRLSDGGEGGEFLAFESKPFLVRLRLRSGLLNRPRIAIVVGMKAEGRIADAGHDLTIVGGGSAAQVEDGLAQAMDRAHS